MALTIRGTGAGILLWGATARRGKDWMPNLISWITKLFSEDILSRGLHCVFLEMYVQLSALVPVNGILFGNKAFSLHLLKWGHSGLSGLEWIQCHYRKGEDTCDPQERRPCEDGQIRTVRLQTKEWQGLLAVPEARKDREGFFPRPSGGSRILPTTWLWDSRFHFDSVREYISIVVSHPVSNNWL